MVFVAFRGRTHNLIHRILSLRRAEQDQTSMSAMSEESGHAHGEEVIEREGHTRASRWPLALQKVCQWLKTYCLLS